MITRVGRDNLGLAAEDDDGHRAFDFAARFAAAEGQREHPERGDERGHEDRQHALARAAGHGFEIPLRAFLQHEMLVVRKEHDAVSHADAEERHEADE